MRAGSVGSGLSHVGQPGVGHNPAAHTRTHTHTPEAEVLIAIAIRAHTHTHAAAPIAAAIATAAPAAAADTLSSASCACVAALKRLVAAQDALASTQPRRQQQQKNKKSARQAASSLKIHLRVRRAAANPTAAPTQHRARACSSHPPPVLPIGSAHPRNRGKGLVGN